MSAFEVVGLVLAGGDALLTTYSIMEQHFEAKRELSLLLKHSKERVRRMCGSINRYSLGVHIDDVPGDILQRVANEFDVIKTELEQISKRRVMLRIRSHTEKVRTISDKLAALENRLDMFGLMSHESASLREQLVAVTEAVRRIALVHEDPNVAKVMEKMDVTLQDDRKSNACEDVDVIPKHARNLLNALSRSGLSADEKMILAKMSKRVWEGWKVNMKDVEFLRKPNGDRLRIGKGGTAEVYLAHLSLRDEHDNVFGEPIEVAVKEFTVSASTAKSHLAQFMREVFCRKTPSILVLYVRLVGTGRRIQTKTKMICLRA